MQLQSKRIKLGTQQEDNSSLEDGMASVQGKLVLELGLAFSRVGISGIGDPAVHLHEDGRAEVLVLVPPVRGARSRAAGATIR